MTAAQLALFSLLGVTLFLFVWGRWRYDVVALVSLMTAVLLGLVPAEGAFAGFGHPATITVAAVLVISRALANTGVVDLASRIVTPLSRFPSAHIGALSGVGGLLSAFINNVGALALLMPVAVQTAVKAGRSPGMVLMPLSFGTILGGLATLIGTPPNIIVAAIRQDSLGDAFGMFDFTPVGGTVALCGVLFVSLIGWRLIPAERRRRSPHQDLLDIEDYVAEARIGRKSKMVGKTLKDFFPIFDEHDVLVVGMARRRKRYPRVRVSEPLRGDDILILEGGPEDLDRCMAALGLKFVGTEGTKASLLSTGDIGIVEAVVVGDSTLDGRTAGSLRLQHRFGVNLLGVSRQGRPHRDRLRAFQFRIGDIVMLHGETERLNEAVSTLGLLPLTGRGLQVGLRGRASMAVAIFISAVAAAAFGVLPFPIALGIAAVAMVLLNAVPLREMYTTVDWPVIVLLGAMIPIGGALQTTGAADVLLDALFGVSSTVTPAVVMVLILVVTMTLSDVLNNAATAVVMAPIAIGAADRLGVSADPMLMAVAVGASCAFLTPIGHQNNALILGPGGYAFGDYWRIGLPLEILIVAVSVPMILWVWPF
ncbi:MAG: SLC13 family permease [Rhodospirillales bacterium]|nr:SLC13 family permease [Rhodospirillales bacterium]MCW9002288.1 SLC13 family permease [Rhodospirillales bacterium]